MFILEDFFTARFGEHGERNVIDDYLKRARLARIGARRETIGAARNPKTGTPISLPARYAPLL